MTGGIDASVPASGKDVVFRFGTTQSLGPLSQSHKRFHGVFVQRDRAATRVVLTALYDQNLLEQIHVQPLEIFQLHTATSRTHAADFVARNGLCPLAPQPGDFGYPS